MSPFVSFNSWRYRERYCMALSTDMPKAILKTIIVEGLIGIFVKPIIAAVISKGIIFGTIDTKIILNEENNSAINKDIITIAMITLSNKLRMRKLVPRA